MDTTIITNTGQENAAVAALTPLQSAIQPYLPEAIIFWWAMWVFMLAYMLVRHMVMPFLRK